MEIFQGGYFFRRWSTWAGLAHGCSVIYRNARSLWGCRRWKFLSSHSCLFFTLCCLLAQSGHLLSARASYSMSSVVSFRDSCNTDEYNPPDHQVCPLVSIQRVLSQNLELPWLWQACLLEDYVPSYIQLSAEVCISDYWSQCCSANDVVK